MTRTRTTRHLSQYAPRVNLLPKSPLLEESRIHVLDNPVSRTGQVTPKEVVPIELASVDAGAELIVGDSRGPKSTQAPTSVSAQPSVALATPARLKPSPDPSAMALLQLLEANAALAATNRAFVEKAEAAKLVPPRTRFGRGVQSGITAGGAGLVIGSGTATAAGLALSGMVSGLLALEIFLSNIVVGLLYYAGSSFFIEFAKRAVEIIQRGIRNEETFRSTLIGRHGAQGFIVGTGMGLSTIVAMATGNQIIASIIFCAGVISGLLYSDRVHEVTETKIRKLTARKKTPRLPDSATLERLVHDEKGGLERFIRQLPAEQVDEVTERIAKIGEEVK